MKNMRDLIYYRYADKNYILNYYFFQANTWQAVLWQVLFPLLDNVIIQSDNASTERVSQSQVCTPKLFIFHIVLLCILIDQNTLRYAHK